MNKISRLFIFCFFSFCFISNTSVFGQGEANIWYFGQNAGMDFTGGVPIALTNGAMVTIEGCASISSASGNLLFYTDGQTVFNKLHAVMTNGTGLLGRTSSTQTAMILNVPGSTTQYYVFTTDAEPNPCSTEGASIAGIRSGLMYSIVDMSVGANGSVVAASKNILIQADPIMEGMTIVPKVNGVDYWLINHDIGTGSFKVRSITSAGVSAATNYTTGLATTNACKYISSIKSNSCYTKLAVAYHEYNSVELYDFNFTTGAVTFANSITTGVTFPYGVEFSPNGTYLYYTNDIYAAREVWQYNVTTTANTMIGNGSPGHVRIGALQLGPDGKIYVANHNWSGTTQIGQIGSPNSAAPAYTPSYLLMGTASSNISQMGLPNYVKSYVSNITNITLPSQICAGTSASFSFTFTGTINAAAGSVQWQWGDASANTLDLNPASHTYASGGPYTITLTIKDNCGVNHITTIPITVYSIVNSAGTVTCAPVTGAVTAPAAYTYVWYSNAAASNAIASGTSVSLPVVGTGNVYLRATSGSSSASTPLSNGTATGHPWGSSDAGTSHTMGFTVNKGPLTFTSFDWEAPYVGWAASNQNTTFNVQLINSGGGVVYNNNRTVATSGPTWVSGYPFTETMSTVLPIGTYTIVITATSGTGGPLLKTTPCISSQTDSRSALVYATSGVCGFAAAFNYSLIEYTVTALSCATIATVPFNCPLPVTWLSFNASRLGGATILKWSTASEQNSKAFHIQRSIDGINFETIDIVDAAGNSNVVQSYDYSDANAPLGSAYYRLLQEDIDGASTFSKIVYVNGIGLLSLSLVPNPGNGSFSLVGLSGDVKLNVAVYSITGQSIFTTTAYPGQVIDLEGVAKGFYIVKIISGSTEQSIRYINQ